MAVARHQLVHRVQAGERIARIKERALVNRLQIVFHVLPRQRGAAQHNRSFDAPLVHDFKILFHDQRGLDQQPAHADGVGFVFLVSVQNRVNRLLDAEIDYPITVVRQNDIDQILADVVHVTLDSRQDHRAFRRGAAFLFHERFEEPHRRLHRLSRLQHERELHLSAAEQIADDFHAFEQNVVDDIERRIFFESNRQLGFESDLLTVDNVVLETLFDGLAFACFLGALGFDVLKERSELGQRIVGADFPVKLTPVINQVARNLLLLFTDAIQRFDLAGVDDGRVEPGFDRVVQEHGIQDHARSRIQAERNVRDPENCEAAGQLALDAANAFNRLRCVAPVLFNPGRDGQRQRVEKDVFSGHAVLLRRLFVGAFGDGKLSVRRARHALFVDRADDHAGAVPLRQVENFCESWLAVFVVGRVQNAFAAGVLQAGFHLLPLSGVEHQRNLDVRHQA